MTFLSYYILNSVELALDWQDPDHRGNIIRIVFVASFMSNYGRRHPTPILIISYETLRLHIDQLKKGFIGIMFCDEVSWEYGNYIITGF